MQAAKIGFKMQGWPLRMRNIKSLCKNYKGFAGDMLPFAKPIHGTEQDNKKRGSSKREPLCACRNEAGRSSRNPCACAGDAREDGDCSAA